MNFFMMTRLYKMIRITKLFKIYNEVTDHTKQTYFKTVLKIDPGVMRLIFFLLLFFLLCHFTACIWVIIAIVNRKYWDVVENELDLTWMDEYNPLYEDDSLHFDLYIVSFYWTITTITTVGYGEIRAVNMSERVFCSMIMVIGVMSFSFANGSLSSILSSSDLKKQAYMQKIETLNLIQRKYNIDPEIYFQMKQSIGYEFNKNDQHINEFVEQLPRNLKIKVNLFIHEERYKNILFFRDKSNAFISWTCPLLKPRLYIEDSYIFLEGDEASSLYFLTKGSCGFVLPSFQNRTYILIETGHMFGIIDILGSA